MRFFTCVLDPEERGATEAILRRYESLPRRRDLEFRWYSGPRLAVLTAWDDPFGDPMFVPGAGPDGDWFAIGTVRLDNRADMARLIDGDAAGLSDIELVLRVVAAHGTRYVPAFIGDFAFVVWNGHTRTAVAACDAFAVRRLYYSEQNGLVAFSSRAEALAGRKGYDVRHLMEVVAQRTRSPDRCAFAGVYPIPRATMALLHAGRSLTIRRYWNASDYAVDGSWTGTEREAADECRRLLAESVRLRMGQRGQTWAHLSGGLDSSSIVSCAQWLTERGEGDGGLAGTVTFVDRDGTGTDEREYSDSVVDRWKVSNTAIINPPTWYDGTCELPHLDQPTRDILVYPRDRRMCATVRAAGGRVLLTGTGGDQLFSGTMLFFADWIVRGRLAAALGEMARRAATGRVSFWQLAYRNALLPLLPRAMQLRLVHDQDEVPTIPWLDHSTISRLGLGQRPAVTAPAYGGRPGQKYHHAAVSMVDTITENYQGGVVADCLDVRHPLLYRPLVEFALGLPPELRARPHAHRWVLRQAMHGILPEQVRTRVGKPGTSDFLAWSLSTEQERLSALVRSPILADLGVVRREELELAFKNVVHHVQGSDRLCATLFNTLAVEMWLQIRSGRWPR
ncbi:MAG TPA: asparagine synthase-related protein [Gemmatimonadaceae bacterium]|nr:asparagine synthase-related protein [Gemmatimonadaceae bacterium]